MTKAKASQLHFCRYKGTGTCPVQLRSRSSLHEILQVGQLVNWRARAGMPFHLGVGMTPGSCKVVWRRSNVAAVHSSARGNRCEPLLNLGKAKLQILFNREENTNLKNSSCDHDSYTSLPGQSCRLAGEEGDQRHRAHPHHCLNLF